MNWSELNLPHSPLPIYKRLGQAVRDRIKLGDLAPGEWLPSSRDLSVATGIHRHTVTTALDELVSEGWLRVEKRRGYQVIDARFPLHEIATSGKRSFDFARRVELKDFAPNCPIKFNFQSGLPDLRLFPVDEFRPFLSDAMRQGELDVLDYGSPYGHEPLRRELETYLLEMRGIKDREVVVTNGSQEAIYIAAQLLLREGDYVAMEELCYPPARETFRLSGAKVVSLQIDNEGVTPDSLARQLRRYPLKLIFLTPTHQFPTTVSMSAERKLAIYRLAADNKVVIIEDDYDHEFHYTSTPPQPIVSMDTAGLVIYVSTFSKALFPGARLGCAVLPSSFAREFAEYRRIITHQNERIMQDAVARWIAAKGMARHIKKMLAVYEERRNVLTSALTEIKARRPKLSWHTPSGGMALWLNTKQDAGELAERALTKGIFVVPGSYYRARGEKSTHLRIGFSNLREDEIRDGIRALAELLR